MCRYTWCVISDTVDAFTFSWRYLILYNLESAAEILQFHMFVQLPGKLVLHTSACLNCGVARQQDTLWKFMF